MLIKVLLLLLGLPLTLPSRMEETHVESEVESSTQNDAYGPKPQDLKKKPPSEEIEPTTTDTHGDDGKLAEATQILNSILKNSNHRQRPGIGEKPTLITVELVVNSFGPVSIEKMEYSIDMTLYQTWYDERLRFNASFDSFVLNGHMLNQLWIPDTYFRNAKNNNVHSVFMHNRVVRIYKDGKVLFTDRITVDVGCSFKMFKYPMDSHTCPLSFSSFSHPENEIIYKWKDFKLEINENNSWRLSQFDFTGVSNVTEIISTIDGDFMVITLFFNVSRKFGFTVIQSYVPSSMTTVISWISFWIKKESSPIRSSLGITSLLTISTLSSCTQKNFPYKSYVTALDVYIAVCLLFCFCALVEFAVLNFLIRTRPRDSPRLRYPPNCACDFTPPRTHDTQQQQEVVFVSDFEESGEETDEEDGPSCSVQQSLSPSLTQRRRSCCRICKYLCVVRSCDGTFWQQGRLSIHIYRLDNYSRVIFPVTFFFFNVLYWVICLNL